MTHIGVYIEPNSADLLLSRERCEGCRQEIGTNVHWCAHCNAAAEGYMRWSAPMPKGERVLQYADPRQKAHLFDELRGYHPSPHEDHGDDVDSDGDHLRRRRTTEIRLNGSRLVVQVLIHVDADHRTAARLLRKLSKHYESSVGP